MIPEKEGYIYLVDYGKGGEMLVVREENVVKASQLASEYLGIPEDELTVKLHPVHKQEDGVVKVYD